MNVQKRKRSPKNEVNAGSMADIAFLLLIFFLVTTQIVEEEGILVKLPPLEDDIIIQPLPERNVFTVKINAENQILAEGNRININELRELTKLFILNPANSPNRPQKPSKAVVSLQNDRETNYELYLEVYNELQAAYREMRQEAAQNLYQTEFDKLSNEKKKEVKSIIPLVISEAEPTSF